MSALIERGASFDGYEVERMLGRGGMGVVYEAVQTSLGRRVALKVLRPELADDPAFVDRLRREGSLQASLEHPHVLDVYEVGESPNGLYLAMRLVDGPTLWELLREGELGAGRTLKLLDQVADALDAAHAAGLVHRDVKPQNVLVGDGDVAYLADFGLTRPESETLTASRPTLGTVAYVAPEVIRGELPGPASDRYAFASTLYHCLSGDVVFPRGSDAAALFAQASEPPPRISERRAELPRALDPVFDQALAKDPEERPATARAIVEAVRTAIGERALAELGPPDRRRRQDRRASDRRAEGVSAAADEPDRRTGTPQRRLALLAAVALLGVLLGAGAVALLQDDDETPAAEVPVPAAVRGAVALGSDLGRPDRSVGCDGRPPGRAVPCSVVQAELPGRRLIAPADGTIVGWAVRGARGELALDVIRPGGENTARVARSQWESAGNAATHRFATSLAVERGDRIGLQMSRGAAIGIREAAGATTQRWLEPTGGFYALPDRDAGTGFDHEVSFRAEFVAGGQAQTAETLTGAEAERAADGRIRQRAAVEISKPAATVNVRLVEVGERVALDLLRGDRRIARTYLPDLLPGGQPVDLTPFTYEDQPVSEVGVWWVNPNSGRMIFHFLNVSQNSIEYLG